MAETLDAAQQLRIAGDLARNPAQAYRTALINADDRPGDVFHVRFSLKLEAAQAITMLRSQKPSD